MHVCACMREFCWSYITSQLLYCGSLMGTLECLLSCRRRGPVGFQSQVMVVTRPNTATPLANCSSHSSSDFCSISLFVVFEVGVDVKDVSIPLLDDQTAEGVESFYVLLVEDEGLQNAILSEDSRTQVLITDYEDYNSVRIQGEQGRDVDCDMELSVKEDHGNIIIPLIREGFTGQEQSVICYTEDGSAIAGEDYISRSVHSPSSHVSFAVNSSNAECVVRIINDQKYELREQFKVHLTATSSNSHVNVPELTSLCVFICFDEFDSPEVVFQNEPVLVQEKKQDHATATFSLYRRGPDLNLTTSVKLYKVVRDGDSAVEGEDYVLYTGSGADCSLEGDDSPGWCVQFSPGQTAITLTVDILPDNILEGDEVFHLRIVYVREGRKSQQFHRSTLAIRILDATKPTYVEFLTHEVTVRENVIFHKIPLRRRGNLDGRAELAYSITGITATGRYLERGFPGDFDFFIVPSYQRVVFLSGQNESVCRITINMDDHFEGVEDLSVSLVTTDSSPTEVVLFPNSSAITVHIVDPEDGPQVKFVTPASSDMSENRVLLVEEPLSSQPPDRYLVRVALIRQRSTDLISTASVSSRDGTAKNGRDFLFEDQEVTFPVGVATMFVTVVILANHGINNDTSLTLELMGLPDHTFDPAYFTFRDSIKIIIENRIVEGPYFLAPPQLDNKEDWGRSYSGGQYSDLPLLCISSCDSMFNTLDQEVLAGCQRQHVNDTRTLYMWEVSVDEGVTFHVLNKSSKFTSPRSRELPTVYLDLGMYVRCQVQAVDNEGHGKYWRVSETVLLNRTRHRCSSIQGPDNQFSRNAMSLTSYSSFRAAEQDFVKLEVRVHASPTEFPIVSINGSNCSTLNQEDGRSLLSHYVSAQNNDVSQLYFHTLYWHFNRASCEWVFSAWLTVRSLIQDCGGQLITGKDGQRVSVVVASELVTYEPSLDIFTSTTARSLTAVSLIAPPADRAEAATALALLPPPIVTLSHLRQPFTYIYPVAVSQIPGDSLLELFLVTSTLSHHFLLPANHSDLQPLFVDEVRGMQGWTVPVDRETWNVTVEMIAVGTAACAQCDVRDHVFVIPMQLEDETGQVGVAMSLEAMVRPTPTSAILLYHGDRMDIHVALSELQVIQDPILRPHLQGVWLCQKVGLNDCSNRYSLMGLGQTSYYSVLVAINSSSFNLSFSTRPLIVVTYPSHWTLHVSYNLSYSAHSLPKSFSLVHGDIMVPFVLHDARVHPPEAPPTLDHSENTSVVNSGSILTVLFVLTSAVLVLGVCVLAVVLVVCVGQGKRRLKAKVSTARANSCGSYCHKPAPSAPGQQRLVKKRPDITSNLLRSSSTIGWPTIERRIQRRRKKGLERVLRRCHSLPALLPVSTLVYACDSPLISRRINLNKVHTRIKRLAKLDYTELYSSSKKKLAIREGATRGGQTQAKPEKKAPACSGREGSGGVAQLVQSVGVGTCGSDARSTMKPEVGVASYAVFLVHSLATSAQTPEPGSHPSSRV